MDTTRMFGKCPVKSCKHRAVVDTPATREPIRNRNQREIGYTLRPVAEHAGMPYTGWWSFWDVYDYLHDEPRRWNPGVTDDRPRCPDHKCLFRWRMLDTSKGPNPDKRCDGRCRSARGPVCDCPCEGEQHGADNLFKL